MMRQFGLLPLLFLSGNLLAGTVGPIASQDPYQFYFGGDISADVSRYRVHATDLCIGCGFTLSQTFDTALVDASVGGGVFAGIGTKLTRLISMGLEGFVDFGGGNAKNVYRFYGGTRNLINGLNSVTFSAKGEWDAGISLLPGIFINDKATLYARVGYINGRYSYQGNPSAIFPGGAGNAQNFSKSTNLNGLQLGLGIQAHFNAHFSCRTEWDVNSYQSTSVPIINSRILNEGSLTFRHPLINQFNFGLIYTV